MNKILAISTHPDDETLGMGGTLLKRRSQGDHLYWMIVTSAKEPLWSKEIIQKKDEEIRLVTQAYGFEKTFRLGFPATKLDGSYRNEIIASMRSVMEEVRPDIVFMMFGKDIHTDHRVAFDCTIVVMKPFVHKLSVRKIYCYETLSSTEMAPPLPENAYIPNAYCDISDYLEEKIRIMGLYKSEKQKFPMPRCTESIRALARFRGGIIGVPYAESFLVLRELL